MSEEQAVKEKLIVEIDGKKYAGYREIIGLRQPHQKVMYRKNTIEDTWTYESWKFRDPKKVMHNKAKILLRELVRQHLDSKVDSA